MASILKRRQDRPPKASAVTTLLHSCRLTEPALQSCARPHFCAFESLSVQVQVFDAHVIGIFQVDTVVV